MQAENQIAEAEIERWFQNVSVDEPTPDEALKILRSIRTCMQVHRGTKITERSFFSPLEREI